MDLIETLSKSFVSHLRNLLKLPKISATNFNAARARCNGIYCEYICINNFTLRNYILNIDFDEFQQTLSKKHHGIRTI